MEDKRNKNPYEEYELAKFQLRQELFVVLTKYLGPIVEKLSQFLLRVDRLLGRGSKR